MHENIRCLRALAPRYEYLLSGKIQAPHTEEHKAKIGAASRGRKDTDDVRIKKSEAAKRRPPLSDEVRARIKAKVKLLWDDPEYRERMKLAHAGHVPSQETRDRMKIAQKKRRAKSASPLSEAM